MTVGAEKLVRMAEQIAANISIDTNDDVVATSVAEHIKRFWDPRMRAKICEYADSDSVELSSIVLKAVRQLA